MRYLLDTNIISDLIRNPRGAVGRHVGKVGEENVCTSIIVAAELRYGVIKKRSPVLSKAVEIALDRIKVLDFENPADIAYAQLRNQLESEGRPIGANDLLIAAHAIASGCTIVTDNAREFSRISALRCVNWLR